MDGAHVALHEMQVRARDGREFSAGEDPGGLRTGPGRPGLFRDGLWVSQHPLVGGRTHGQGADFGDEGRVTRVVHIAQGEQPLQGVVLGGDVAVQAGGGVVLGVMGTPRKVSNASGDPSLSPTPGNLDGGPCGLALGAVGYPIGLAYRNALKHKPKECKESSRNACCSNDVTNHRESKTRNSNNVRHFHTRIYLNSRPCGLERRQSGEISRVCGAF